MDAENSPPKVVFVLTSASAEKEEGKFSPLLNPPLC